MLSPNLLILLFGLGLLLVIGLFWASLALKYRQGIVQSLEQSLQEHLEKQRDYLPYLLETVKKGQGWAEFDSLAREIIQSRAYFQEPKVEKKADYWEQVRNLEELWQRFIQENQNLKTANFREAKKELNLSQEIIQQEKELLAQERQNLLALQKRFPYALVSKFIR